MRPVFLLCAALLAAGSAACASQPPAASPPPAAGAAEASIDATEAWKTLRQALPGRWVATTASGRSVEVSYREISRGSAILELFGANAAEQTATVYHPDGRALLLTHYCAQGNQARLRAVSVGPGRVVFEQVGATNVAPDQSVLHDLVFELGPDSLQRTEVYRAHDGTLETTVLRFVRRPGPP